MITFSEPKDKIVAALFAAEKNLGDLKKNATNPHFKSKYADLGATNEAIQPGLDAGKLLVIQAPLTAPDGAVGVETMILHESGQWVRPDPLFLPLAKADPQGAGSAITYARRYALAAFFNLAPEDDDGAAASTRSRPRSAARPTPPEPVLDETPLEALHDEIYGLFATLQMPPKRAEEAVQWASTGRTVDHGQLDATEAWGLIKKLRAMKVQAGASTS